MSQYFPRAIRLSAVSGAAMIALLVGPQAAKAQIATLTFDSPAACGGVCNAFSSPILSSYGTGMIPGVTVTVGILNAFSTVGNLGTISPSLSWGSGTGPASFSSGFAFGDQNIPPHIGAFKFVSPGLDLSFLGMKLSTNAVGTTADVRVYDLTGNLLWENGVAAPGAGSNYNLAPGSVTSVGAAPAVNGGFVVEFTDSPTSLKLANTFVDNVSFGVVPEPATMSLLAVGLVGMAGMRRRKRQS